MAKTDKQAELKSIKLLQQRADYIRQIQQSIATDIQAIIDRLHPSGDVDRAGPVEGRQVRAGVTRDTAITPRTPVEAIHEEAKLAFPENVSLEEVLTADDWVAVDNRVAAYVEEFNARYALDRWDYAIAGGCGLFAAMLDLLCIRAPDAPTVGWSKTVDGIFNRVVQEAFNHVLTPELSKDLGRLNTIGGADSSTVAQLLGAPPRTLNPMNHRLRALSHDPVLGFLFGVLDMRRGTCTVIEDGALKIYPTTRMPVECGFFGQLGRLFGHLLSDVNAPTPRGNRGMGLPAPFMGLYRMFDNLPTGESNLGKQVEYMYVRGYDFRQFIVTSIPALLMEVLMRVLYAVKQVKCARCSLGEALVETAPGNMNPRFRMMLAMAYGTVAAINGGKVYVTENILNLNYAFWLGLIWNGFHAMKWALLDKSRTFWRGVEDRELESLERVIRELELLEDRARRLPVGP